MRKKRILLEKKGYLIADEAFVKDALSNHPGGESKETGVFDAVKLMAKKELGKAVLAYDRKQLKNLERVHRECVKEDFDGDDGEWASMLGSRPRSAVIDAEKSATST